MGKLDHVTLELVNNFDKAQDFMRWLSEDRGRTVLGVDTETGGFTPHRDRLRLIQFGDKNAGWALPWERWSGLAIEVLNRYDGDIVLHNSQFDMRFITTHAGSDLSRWRWEKTWDTMTMAHIIDAKRPKGLKTLAAMHVDSKAVAAQRVLDEGMADNKWTWDTVPLAYDPYWVYAALDPVLTCHIYDHLKPQITAPALLDLEMATLRIVSNMMLKGARVDLDYSARKSAELANFANETRARLAEEFGVQNATSIPQVAKALKEAGVDLLPKRTKAGYQALDKEVLEAADHPIAEMVLQIKAAEKMVGTYFKNFLGSTDADDRVHPTIWALGARTGRMTIQDPALQTLPKKDGVVRSAFIPSDGNVLVSVDADQIEARLAAHFSQDEGLKAAFLSDEDFFVHLARDIFRDSTLQKSDKRRQLTKGVVYGKLYGAGPETMAKTAKVPFEQMVEVVNGFDATFPGVRMLQKAIENVAYQRKRETGEGFIITPMGRRLPADDEREYTLVNYLIQAHAAEIFKQNLVKLDAIGLGDYLMLPVHDEIVMDVPRDEGDEVLNLAIESMNDADNYFVPISWSGEVIDGAWGSKYE